MKNTITVKDAKIDSYTEVLALNRAGNDLAFYQYGMIEGSPYVSAPELIKALKAYKPRTDSDRWAFIKKHELDIDYMDDVDGGVEYIDCFSAKSGLRIGEKQGFTDLTEAIDYLMDMEEGA